VSLDVISLGFLRRGVASWWNAPCSRDAKRSALTARSAVASRLHEKARAEE